MSQDYKIEDKAKEILNVLKESNIDIETLDYKKLEEVLIKSNKDK